MENIPFHELLDQDNKRNSIAFVERLKEQGPLVHFSGPVSVGDGWIVMNYDDSIAILKDARFIKDIRKIVPSEAMQASIEPSTELINRFLIFRHDMLSADLPDHTRLRRLVAKAFTPRAIELLQTRIQQITDELLDVVQNQGQMDLIADFAFPLPITVISEMLGIPVKDQELFRTLSQAIIHYPDVENMPAILEAFVQYMKTFLAEKRTHPADDLISSLIQAEERGDTLSEDELISTTILLIVAGHETTANLIGNGTLALLQHPDQLRLLRTDPLQLPSAIEELLRYTVPVFLTSLRWASEDVSFRDQVIHKGDLVLVSLLGANIDSHQFSDPKTLDITRQDNQHLAFGKGIHACLGAPLARLEGQIAFGTLLQRMPNLRLAVESEHLTWTPSIVLRGLTSLPVMF